MTFGFNLNTRPKEVVVSPIESALINWIVPSMVFSRLYCYSINQIFRYPLMSQFFIGPNPNQTRLNFLKLKLYSFDSICPMN